MIDDAQRTVRDLGEFGLIDALRAALPPETVAGDRLQLGIGDDAAIWRPTPDAEQVITTDSLVEGVHFRLDWTDWASLGHKTLAVNLSDIAAMGAWPRLAVLSLGLRGDERVADLERFYHGLGRLAAATGTLIAGGDIVASPTALTLHLTALGDLPGCQALTRAGAKAGDLIAVSGTLGASAAGLRLLSLAPASPQRRATSAPALIASHLRPEPRLRLGHVLRQHGASAAMDLSDGLLGDLPKMLQASQVAAEIDATAIPVAAAVRALFPDDWFALATRGGEDYELLFTAAPPVMAAIVSEAAVIGATVTTIGAVQPQAPGHPRLTLRQPSGEAQAIEGGAFDHFRAGT